MFDFNTANAGPIRRPMPNAGEVPTSFAPAAPQPMPMEVPQLINPQGGGGGGVNSNSINALTSLASAMAMKSQGGQASRRGADAPMPQMKRPVPYGPPFETNA